MRIILILIIVLFAVPKATGQDLMDQIKEAAKQYDESEEGQKGNTDDDQKSKKDAQKQAEYKKEWEEAWKQKKEEWAKLNVPENSYQGCLDLMVLYFAAYLVLDARTEAEENCRMKYDLYGMQVIAITSSTTIMYCPEELYNLSDSKINKIETEFIKKVIDSDKKMGGEYGVYYDYLPVEIVFNHIYPGWQETGMHLVEDNYFVKQLLYYFTPGYVVTKTVSLGNKMEALGCGDY